LYKLSQTDAYPWMYGTMTSSVSGVMTESPSSYWILPAVRKYSFSSQVRQDEESQKRKQTKQSHNKAKQNKSKLTSLTKNNLKNRTEEWMLTKRL
jgi:hypothetical protein